MTFPESRFVKLPNSVSRSKLQSRLSLPIFSKIPNPGLQKRQIPDPEKPIGDPHLMQYCCDQKWFIQPESNPETTDFVKYQFQNLQINIKYSLEEFK